MLSGVIRFSQSDCAIAVSGIAGPEGGSEEKPVGTVYIGWLAKGQTAIIERLQYSGDRESVRFQSVEYALSRSLQIFR
jgi:nicotinamide-nucleotide amidase